MADEPMVNNAPAAPEAPATPGAPAPAGTEPAGTTAAAAAAAAPAQPRNLVRELIDSGIHFGHRAARWNPKMEPYIYGKRNKIHIIDVRETLKGLLRARKLVGQVVAGGDDVVFVGTKRQARLTVKEQAERCGMPYVNERWLGGTLTNFRTIRSRLGRLEELEKLEEAGQLDAFSKKEAASLQREKRKILRNLGGIRAMNRIPGTLIIIDVRREHIALKEAHKIGVPTIALIDTDSDPDYVDLPIPGNDDAMRGIELVLTELADAVIEGKANRAAAQDAAAKAQAAPAAPSRRRPRRPTTTQQYEQALTPTEQMLAGPQIPAAPKSLAEAALAAAQQPQAEPADVVVEPNRLEGPTQDAAAPPAEGPPAQDAAKPAEPPAVEGPPTQS